MFRRLWKMLIVAVTVMTAAFAAAADDQQQLQEEVWALPLPMPTIGEREARAIKYGDWQKLCFKPGGAKMVCRTSISGTFETGQTAVRIYVVEREGDSAARLQLFLPVGLYVRPGVKLAVDKGTAYKVPFSCCLTNTCIAGDAANPALLREMEAGKNLALEVIDTNMLSVSTSLPLGQFAAVRKGAPAKIFEQNIDE